MKIIAQSKKDKLSRRILSAFYQHIALFANELKIDSLKVDFANSHETVLSDNEATIRINPKDSVFQDAGTINPFVCQEIIRVKTRTLELPRFLEDILCGREAAKLYPMEFFQLCYLSLLKYKKIKNLRDFLDANKYWIIFCPLDSYNSEFLKGIANKIRRDKKLEMLCRPLFNASKNSLSSSENLNNAIKAYESLMKHAGD